MNAHYGFFKLSVAANNESQLCAKCHEAADPIGEPSALLFPPNGHTLYTNFTGSGSHYIGTFTNAITSEADIAVKTSSWREVLYKNNSTVKVYAKYGASPDTHHKVADDLSAHKMVCESCHSILFNAGWDGLSSGSHPSWGSADYTAWRKTGGWKTNLLLQLYEDRAPGVGNLSNKPDWNTNSATVSDVDGADTGSGFCVECHRHQAAVGDNVLVTGAVHANAGPITSTIVPQRMHPMTDWSITRAKDTSRPTTTLITTGTGVAGTYADKAGSPNDCSYPVADAMDCDSCHRPHRASGILANTAKTGTPAGMSVILEKSRGTSQDPDGVCVQCHNR